jgi:hypothetical protein
MSTKFRNPTEESINLNKNNDIKILKRVRTQLKVARNHFRNNREVIARLYSDVSILQPLNDKRKYYINYIILLLHCCKIFKNLYVFISN